MAFLVARHNQRAEAETAATLDDFGGTIDKNNLLNQLGPAALLVRPGAIGWRAGHGADRGRGRRDCRAPIASQIDCSSATVFHSS